MIQVPFPCERYAEIAMRTIGVEPAFSDTKTKRSSIERAMHIDVLENGVCSISKVNQSINMSCDTVS